jgi:hypothetical protein
MYSTYNNPCVKVGRDRSGKDIRLGIEMGQVRRNYLEMDKARCADPNRAVLRILAIGPARREDEDASLVRIPGTEFLPFAQLTAERIHDLEPDVVISPLVTQQFDCLEVAFLLTEAGYRGRYRALAAMLPRPDMVRREVRSSFPEIDFDVVLVGPAARSAGN